MGARAFGESRSPFVPICLGLLFIFSALCLPLRHGMSFGGDEGTEIEKALLVSSGFRLYSEIWSDQPALYTRILAALIKLAGPGCLLPRLFSVLVGAGVIFIISYLAQRMAGSVAGILAGVAFMSMPVNLVLSCAIMQEIPTTFFSMSAVFCALAQKPYLRRWLAPLLAAMAVHIKLTAVLFLPAVALSFLWLELRQSSGKREVIWRLGQMLATIVVVWLLLIPILGMGSPMQILGTHLCFTDEARGTAQASTMQFRRDVWPFIDLYLGAVLGLVMACKRRCDAPWIATLALVASQILFCAFYKPWWPMYMVGVSVPLSIMLGVGFSSLLRDGISAARASTAWAGFLKLAVGIIVTTYAVFFALLRWSDQYDVMTHVRDLRADPVVLLLRDKARAHHWIYSEDEMLAFHGRLLLAPELAVTSIKRRWSGQITTNEIVRVCQTRDIRLALLFNHTVPIAGDQLRALGFKQCFQDDSYTVLEKR